MFSFHIVHLRNVAYLVRTTTTILQKRWCLSITLSRQMWWANSLKQKIFDPLQFYEKLFSKYGNNWILYNNLLIFNIIIRLANIMCYYILSLRQLFLYSRCNKCVPVNLTLMNNKISYYISKSLKFLNCVCYERFNQVKQF